MDNPTRPKLGVIKAVTYSVADLSSVEDAYVGVLGYRVLGRSSVTDDQALAWGAPGVAGRALLLLGPQSGEDVHLRFVQSEHAAGWRALRTFGWNATEFVVQDVDALAARLSGGPFEIIGPPKGLSRFPMIRAMQAIGPAGECCYFTEVGPGSGLTLAPALSFVGRVFIAVAAGPDADALFKPYSAFSNAVDLPVATAVKIISDAHGLAPDTLHRHGLVRLEGGTLIELDAYPPSTPYRTVPEGELAPGMAIVSITVDTLPRAEMIGPTYRAKDGGSDGNAGCIRGAVGELIELLDTSDRQEA